MNEHYWLCLELLGFGVAGIICGGSLLAVYMAHVRKTQKWVLVRH